MNNIDPPYYKPNKGGSVELWDLYYHPALTSDPRLTAYLSNILKYVYRYKKKNGLEDLKKARAYLKKCQQIINTDPPAPPLEEFLKALGLQENSKALKIFYAVFMGDLEGIESYLEQLMKECENEKSN